MFLSVLHDGLLELKEDEGVYDGELVGARQPRPTTGPTQGRSPTIKSSVSI
jgi:hypothetical protein